MLCKCLLEPGVDSGKLLNYFKQRTKVLSLPLSSWILVKTKQNRNLCVNHLTMISTLLSWQERGGRGVHRRMEIEQLRRKKTLLEAAGLYFVSMTA